jgi:hypothetical protein
MRLFRGMLARDLAAVQAQGIFRATRHGGNVASVDVSTARHWAGQRAEEDDPAVVVEFDAPDDAVAVDPWFKDDYRFVRDFEPRGLRVVESGITGPVREAVRRRRTTIGDLRRRIKSML